MTVRIAVVGAVIGAASAVAYTVSPLTCLFALAVPVLLRWAGAGLGRTERRWVYAALAAAIALRVVAVAGALLLTDPVHQQYNVYFPDAQFAISKSWWIRNLWRDVPIGPWYTSGTYNPYGASSYSYVLAAIQLLVGASPYGVNFVSVAAFLVAAISLFRLVRTSYGPVPAFVGLVFLLFWPTTAAWSVSALKESSFFALTALALVFAARAVRTSRWRRGAAVVAVLAAGYALSTLRAGAILIAAVGIACGLIGRALTVRRAIAVAVVLAAIAIAVVLLPRASIQNRLMSLSRLAAERQIGNVISRGWGYKVLDQRFYSEGSRILSTMRGDEAVRFLAKSVIAFFVVPAPWQIVTVSAAAFLPQQLAWYVLVLLGAAGVVAGLQRDPLVTWLLLGYFAAGALVIAPNSGNIGTLVRHRDMVMPALVWLSALGATSLLAKIPPRAAVAHVVAAPLGMRATQA